RNRLWRWRVSCRPPWRLCDLRGHGRENPPRRSALLERRSSGSLCKPRGVTETLSAKTSAQMKTLAAFLLAGLLCIAGLPAHAAGAAEVSFEGRLEPGALVIGRTAPGARVTLDGVPLMVSANGLFALGFDRDHGPAARLVVTSAQGRSQTHALRLAPRDYAVQRIEGVAPKYVTPPPEALARIRKE